MNLQFRAGSFQFETETWIFICLVLGNAKPFPDNKKKQFTRQTLVSYRQHQKCYGIDLSCIPMRIFQSQL